MTQGTYLNLVFVQSRLNPALGCRVWLYTHSTALVFHGLVDHADAVVDDQLPPLPTIFVCRECQRVSPEVKVRCAPTSSFQKYKQASS